MSSQSWYSCGLLNLLWLVGVLVLSNPVFSSSPPPKPAQDHKVSICITLMCMMISCWFTYCLQEEFINMVVHFLTTSFALMHIAKIHVTLCLLCHNYAFTCSYILSSHDCICYMFLQSFTYYSWHHLLEALIYVVINYKKGGDWKHNCSLGDFHN